MWYVLLLLRLSKLIDRFYRFIINAEIEMRWELKWKKRKNEAEKNKQPSIWFLVYIEPCGSSI